MNYELWFQILLGYIIIGNIITVIGYSLREVRGKAAPKALTALMFLFHPLLVTTVVVTIIRRDKKGDQQ